MNAFAIAMLCAASLAGAAYASPQAALPQLPAMPTKAEAAALAAQGARPGDEAMTCDQLGMELQPYVQPMMPSMAALGETGKQVQALGEKQKAQAMTQAPLSIGVGIASSFIPGGGIIAQAQAANQYAQMKKRADEAKPLNDKMLSQGADLMTQAAPMQQDPRFQRLMQLAEAKCQGVR
jgi:hypothetical protein